MSDESVGIFNPGSPADTFGDEASLVAPLPAAARGLAAHGDHAWMSGADGQLYQVHQFGAVTAFGDPSCVGSHR